MAETAIKKNENRNMYKRVFFIASTYSFAAAFLALPVAAFFAAFLGAAAFFVLLIVLNG